MTEIDEYVPSDLEYSRLILPSVVDLSWSSIYNNRLNGPCNYCSHEQGNHRFYITMTDYHETVVMCPQCPNKICEESK